MNQKESKKKAKSKKNGGQKQQPKSARMGMKQAAPKGVAAAYSSQFLGKSPQITQSANSIRIRHRELVGTVTGSVNYAVGNTFQLNPGLMTTFPWLSLMAQAWEQYEFHQLCLHYNTRTGTNVPGSVMLVPDYDAADAAPADEASASSYQDAVEDAPWKDLKCVLRKQSMHGGNPRKFIRSSSLSPNLDIKTYDVGNLFVLTQDGTAVPWGKLWLEYDVSFYIPQLPSSLLPIGGKITSGAGETAANCLGTSATLDAAAKGITFDQASGVVTFTTIGDYLVTWDVTGTVISAMTEVLGAGLVAGSAAVSVIDTVPALTGMQRSVIRVVTVGNVAVPATLSFSATATTITDCKVFIALAPPNSLT